MEQAVLDEMYIIADEYFTEPDLNELLKTFIREKSIERSIWGDMTRSVHYMLGGTSPQIVRAAAMTEMVVLALDIIDDLQDQDNFTKPWMNTPPGFTLNAVLAFLFAFAGELSIVAGRQSGNTASILKEIGHILATAVNGQQRDINGTILTEQDYVTVVQQKSGSLIRFACFMGIALIEQPEQSEMERFNDLSDCIGLIAQIRNDVNDLLRYDVKNDLLHKKRTLPILFLLVDSHEEFPILTQYYEGEVSQEDFLLKKLECLEYVRGSGCLEYSQIIQALYKERAEKLLEGVAASVWKDRFVEITIGA